MYKFLILLVSAFMVACGGGGDSGVDNGGDGGSGIGEPSLYAAHIACADVDTKDIEACEEEKQPTAFAAASVEGGSRIIETGEINAGDMVFTYTDVENDGEDFFYGYINMVMAPGCGTMGDEHLFGYKPLEIAPGEINQTHQGVACDSMHLGDGTITVTVYAADPEEIVDEVVVKYTVVEPEQ